MSDRLTLDQGDTTSMNETKDELERRKARLKKINDLERSIDKLLKKARKKGNFKLETCITWIATSNLAHII